MIIIDDVTLHLQRKLLELEGCFSFLYFVFHQLLCIKSLRWNMFSVLSFLNEHHSPSLCLAVSMADVPAHFMSTSSSFEREGDQELLEWLKHHGVDADSTERVLHRK